MQGMLKFRWCFFRARLNEIAGKFANAAKLLEHCDAPAKYQSLRDAYRLTMLVLANSPRKGPEIMKAAEQFRWYKSPKWAGDEYAVEYCKYVTAAVNGESQMRQALALSLGRMPVPKVYRNALRITD